MQFRRSPCQLLSLKVLESTSIMRQVQAVVICPFIGFPPAMLAMLRRMHMLPLTSIAIKHSICSPSFGMFMNEIWAKVKFARRQRHSKRRERRVERLEWNIELIDWRQRQQKSQNKYQKRNGASELRLL